MVSPLLNCSDRLIRYFWSLCKRFDRQNIWSCVRLMSQLKFDSLYDNFQVNLQAVCLFFNLEKAKGTNWRYGIRDIHRFGLRGNLPIFVSEYLRDRRIRVRIGTTFWRILPRGRFSTWWCTGQDMFWTEDQWDALLYYQGHLQSSLCWWPGDLFPWALPGHHRKTSVLTITIIQGWVTINGFRFAAPKCKIIHFIVPWSKV